MRSILHKWQTYIGSDWKLHWKKVASKTSSTKQYSITTFHLNKLWRDFLHLWLLSSVLAEENGVKLVQILAEWPLTTHVFALCFAFYCDKMKIIMLTSWTWPGKPHRIKRAGAQVWLCPAHSCLSVSSDSSSHPGKVSGFLLWKTLLASVSLRVCLTVSVADSCRKGFRQDWNASDSVLYPGVKLSVVLIWKRGCRNIATWHDSAWDPDGAQVLNSCPRV